MKDLFLTQGIKTIRIAQKEILKYYNNEKPNDLDIDEKIEILIKNEILNYFPQHSFNGEETGLTDNNSNYIWYCDPIACTMNFNENIPHFASCLSLFANNICILGIVIDPVTDELYYADEEGAFLEFNNQKIKLIAEESSILEKRFFCCSSKNDYEKLIKIQKEFNMFHKLPGSWGLSFAWCAKNKFVFAFGRLKDIHGTAPGIFISQIAGCYIKDYSKRNWDINSKDIIIAQNKQVYDKIINFIL